MDLTKALAVQDMPLGIALTEHEKFILDGLISDETRSLNMVVPDSATDDEIRSELEAVSKVQGRITKANIKIKPVVGRLLAVIKKRPSVHKSLGYKSFDAFVSEGIPLMTGMTRGEAYQCKAIAEKFPSSTINDYETIGYVKLGLLCKATEDGAPSRDEWFEAARDKTVDQLKQTIAQGTGNPRDELDIMKIEFVTTKARGKAITKFLEGRAATSYCGTKDKAEIIEAMIAEVELGWLAQLAADMQ